MNSVPVLAAERPYLQLNRADREAAIVAAVAALDQQILVKPTQLLRREVQRMDEFAGTDRTVYRYASASGEWMFVNIPRRVADDEAELIIADLARLLERP